MEVDGTFLLLVALVGFFVYYVSQKEKTGSSELAQLRKELLEVVQKNQQAPIIPQVIPPYPYYPPAPQASQPSAPASPSISASSLRDRRSKAQSRRASEIVDDESSVSSSLARNASFSNLEKLQDTLKTLESQNRQLVRQLRLTEVSNVVENEEHVIKMSPAEIETIRAIFSHFDVRQAGTIRSSDIKNLHQKLGEPLTEDEAVEALSELDPEGTGEVTFDKFLLWFAENHKEGKKGSKYTQRFKTISAKLTPSSFDADRVITQESGNVGTLEYRVNFYYKQKNGAIRQISPWHDVPLFRLGTSDGSGQLYNFVCEIPKWTRAKFEIATGETFNPIKQDTKSGQLRFYRHGDMMFNYGAFPQTWENPSHIHPDTKCPGDNDPIDCLEIGSRQLKTGQIVPVKILGVLALIDDGETDWKIIAISIHDPLAHVMNDIDDVETHLPGAIRAIREYLRDYKNYSGGSKNYYALKEQAMPRDYATKIVEETHQHWNTLHMAKKDTVSKAAAADLALESASSPNSSASLSSSSLEEKEQSTD